MLASEPITLARTFLNDPSNLGRWSDTSLIAFLNQAQQELIRDVEYPESRMSALTVPYVQEYVLPEFIKIYRVYVAGQLLVPTDLSTLQGQQSMDYDQGTGSPFQAQSYGSGGPLGTVGTYSPAWNTQAPAVYPLPNSWGSPAPDAQGWAQGQRPRWYMRGGYIGLVPAPAVGAVLAIDCLRSPQAIGSVGDTMVLPEQLCLALAWKITELAKYADDGDRAADSRNYAADRYEKEMRKARKAFNMRDGDQNRGPKLFTRRRLFASGNNRNGRGGANYP